MPDTTGTTDLPPRLGDQQRFILAVLADYDDGVDMTYLSWEVAREFDGETSPFADMDIGDLTDLMNDDHDDDESAHGDRIVNREAARNRMMVNADSPAAVNRVSTVFGMFRHAEKLKSAHNASFSRSVAALEERGLVERGGLHTTHADGRETYRTAVVGATDAGRAAGEELRRRHGDGRYSLHFDTLP